VAHARVRMRTGSFSIPQLVRSHRISRFFAPAFRIGPQIADRVAAFLLTCPALGVYVLLRIFMVVLPPMQQGSFRGGGDSEDEIARSIGTNWRLSGTGAFIIDCYHRSFLHAYLHRSGPRCCFLPTCSEYLVRAVEKYGFRMGLVLATDRLRRCKPDATGAYVDFP
jgi:uncharacterized protein